MIVRNVKSSRFNALNPRHIYCGRDSYGYKGIGLGNPHPVGFCRICNTTHARGEAVAAFKHDLESGKLPQVEQLIRTLHADSELFCWCSPQPCHCDVIAAWHAQHTST